MSFKNFKMWRARLPHWRADDVRYYVTFRHRRPLDSRERSELFRRLLRPDGTKWSVMILCVLPEETHLMFTVGSGVNGSPFEFSEVLETAKRKAGSSITKRTGERFSPFYGESFDRIVRDDAEFEERWLALIDLPEAKDLGPAEDYDGMWVACSQPD